MKKAFLLVLLVLVLPSLTGCAGCGCRERLRDCFRRGAICGSSSTVAAPSPIVYSQPAPVQQYVQPQQQPQFVQPTVPAPAPAPQPMVPQYAAPAPQYCVPCCPQPVCQPCCPTYDPCACPPGGYTVGSPIYEGGWMSSGCCGSSTTYGGSYESGPITTEPRPSLPSGSPQPNNASPNTDPGPSA